MESLEFEPEGLRVPQRNVILSLKLQKKITAERIQKTVDIVKVTARNREVGGTGRLHKRGWFHEFGMVILGGRKGEVVRCDRYTKSPL